MYFLLTDSGGVLMHFKIGDSVKVKPGIIDPDFKLDLGGYQGRITEAKASGLYSIQWDSVTLRQMPHNYIRDSESQDFIWDRFDLSISDFELATPRDTQKEVEQISSALHNQFFWASFGETGTRIEAVLSEVERPQDDASHLPVWHSYLMSKLTLPFQAEVAEWQEESQEKEHSLQCDDIVTVRRIVEAKLGVEYGLLAEIDYQPKPILFSLAELEALDKQSPNFILIQDYACWFVHTLSKL